MERYEDVKKNGSESVPVAKATRQLKKVDKAVLVNISARLANIHFPSLTRNRSDCCG